MNRTFLLAAATFLASASTAVAHRVDEYLEATTFLVSRESLQVQMRLAPGVMVATTVLDSIDTNRDGTISDTEGHEYGLTVLRDLSLTLDDAPLPLRLASWRSGTVEELRRGLGEIQLAFDAKLPAGGRQRQLVFENRHRSAIAAYLVNSLVPEEPGIRITNQRRNYRQSVYEMVFEQGSANSRPVTFGSLMRWGLVFAGVTIVIIDRLSSLRRRRHEIGYSSAR